MRFKLLKTIILTLLGLTPMSLCYAAPYYIGILIGNGNNNYQHINLNYHYHYTINKDAGVTLAPVIGYQLSPTWGLQLSTDFLQHISLTHITDSQGHIAHDKIRLLSNLTSLLGTYSYHLPFLATVSVQSGFGMGFTGRTGIKDQQGHVLLKEDSFFRPVMSFAIRKQLRDHLIFSLQWVYSPKNTQNQLPPMNFYAGGCFYQF